MTLLPPSYLDTVVALGHKDNNGSTSWCATGFLYGYHLKTDGEIDYHFVCLVTNRHVFEKQKSIIVRFNKIEANEAREYNLDLVGADNKQLWFCHTDSTVDYAVIFLDTDKLKEDSINYRYFRQKTESATLQEMYEKGISEGDGVFVLGYPLGIVDPIKNYVIVRSGVIAKISDSYFKKKASFIIDSSVFPGSSGGPVVTRPEIISVTGTKAYDHSTLIGIISSYILYEDVAISQQTGKPRVVFQENSGLANVVPIDFLNEIIEERIGKLEPQDSPPEIPTYHELDKSN